MKKQLLSILLATFFGVFFLTSCGGGESEPTLQERLQGTWVLGTVTGAQASFIAPNTGFRITFSGNNVTIVINGQTLNGTFTVSGTTVTTTVQYNGGTVVLSAVTLSGAGDIALAFSTDLKRTEAKPVDSFTFNLNKQ